DGRAPGGRMERTSLPSGVGIAFPPGPDGQPSSRLAGTRTVSGALGGLDAEHASDALREARWRHAYPRHFRRLVEGAMGSPQAALASARAGLETAWDSVHFATPDGTRALREGLWIAPPRCAVEALNDRRRGMFPIADRSWTDPLSKRASMTGSRAESSNRAPRV